MTLLIKTDALLILLLSTIKSSKVYTTPRVKSLKNAVVPDLTTPIKDTPPGALPCTIKSNPGGGLAKLMVMPAQPESDPICIGGEGHKKYGCVLNVFIFQ